MIKISYSLLILMLSTFAFTKPSVSDCQKLKEIETRNVTVYYPEFVPELFSKTSITTDSVEIEGKDYFDYEVELCDPNQLCFSVASMSEGIGSPPSGNRILSGTSKIFGKFSVEVFDPGTEGNASSEVYYLSDWLKHGQRYYHVLGRGISDQEKSQLLNR